MDKYEAAARELLGKQCPLIVFGWFASAFRWYHETYLQPAIDAAVKEALEKRDRETCKWKDDGDSNWDTECKNIFVFIDGTPRENDAVFCPYCGRRIVEKEAK